MDDEQGGDELLQDPYSAPDLQPTSDSEAESDVDDEATEPDLELTQEARMNARAALLSEAPRGRDLREADDGGNVAVPLPPPLRGSVAKVSFADLADMAWNWLKASARHALLTLRSHM